MPTRPWIAFMKAGGLAGLGAVTALTSACGGQGPAPAASQSDRAALMPERAVPDACRLLAAIEAQTYLGALTSPPFRSDGDGVAQTNGEACTYRGSEARQLIVTETGPGAGAAGEIMNDIPTALGNALEKAGAKDLATVGHRVMAPVADGPWDKATWIPSGTLFIAKADAGANIDVSGAGGKQADAVALARLIVPRFTHPLDYDGAKASAALPATKPPPASACDVISPAAVAAAIGPLDGAPAAGSDRSQCVYHVASAAGPRTYTVGFTWEGGVKNFNMLKNSMSTLGSMMGGNIPTAGMDSMKMDPTMSKAIGGLMSMVGGGGGAPGAATQVGFKTDTTLKGPWDSAMLLHGTQLLAVKHDTMVALDLQSADYEKAKTLLAALCTAL